MNNCGGYIAIVGCKERCSVVIGFFHRHPTPPSCPPCFFVNFVAYLCREEVTKFTKEHGGHGGEAFKSLEHFMQQIPNQAVVCNHREGDQ